MVIEGIMNALLRFFEFLFGWLNIPDMPTEVITVLNQLKVYIMNSMNLVGFFFDMTVLKVIMGCWAAIFLAVNIYKFVNWIMDKVGKFT